MPLLRRLHESQVHSRRVVVLARHLCELLPRNTTVLDVGAGDGLLAVRVLADRPDVQWTAVDTLARPNARFPTELFDGIRLPFADDAFDTVLFVDVLHHADDPMALLREGVRVARGGLLIKDHLREGLLAGPVLRFMDWVGNAGWGVHLPYHYWEGAQWENASRELGLHCRQRRSDLGLYPWWANWCFGRSLHFIAQFDVQSEAAA